MAKTKELYYKDSGVERRIPRYTVNVSTGRVSEALVGLDKVPEFSITSHYFPGDLFMYKGELWRTLVDHTGNPGQWVWATKTSLYSEILKMAQADYINKRVTLTETQWDLIEGSPGTLSEFIRNYAGYCVDVVEDYEDVEPETDATVSGERLILTGYLSTTGALVLAGTVVSGNLTLIYSPEGSGQVNPNPSGSSAATVEGGGVLTGITGSVSGSGVLTGVTGEVLSGNLTVTGGGGTSGGSGSSSTTAVVSSNGVLEVTSTTIRGTVDNNGTLTINI